MVEKSTQEKLDQGIRTFGIDFCISEHVENHRILAMGIIALKKKLLSPYYRLSGQRMADTIIDDYEKQLHASRKQLRENKQIISLLLLKRDLPSNVIDLEGWKRRR